MKKKIGLAAFIAVCFVVCFAIDQTSKEYNFSPKTYGEYQDERESKAVTASVAVTSENTEKAGEENESAKESQEEKELIKRAYLTFDDGPSYNTPKILEILKKYNIKATFFLISGEITEEYEDLIRQMVADGHSIGVHTYSHKQNEIYENKEACMEDIKKAYDRLLEVTGVAPIYYRFPYGSANCYVSGYCNAVIRELNNMGLSYIDWNVDSQDSIGEVTEYSIVNNIKSFDKYMEPVLLFHDGRGNDLTPTVLEEVIEKIIAAGYQFGTMEERSKPYQWPHNWQEN